MDEYDATPVVDMRILYDEPIPMDDGIDLRANVYLPPEEGEYPVVLALTSYAKDLPFCQGYPGAWENALQTAPEIAEGTSGKYISFEAVDPEKWIPHGYAVVVVDCRGVGRSPGYLDNYSPRESQDYHDAIEWAAAQPWSTGKIGTMGMSNLAVSQWLVAGRQAPHHAGMIAWEAWSDMLRGLSYHGGIPSTFYKSWADSQVKSVQHGLGARGFRNQFTGKLVSGDEELTQEQLDANIADPYPMLMENPLDSGLYDWRRAKWDKIEVPLLSVGSWGAVGVHLRGNCEGFMLAASEEKWLVIRQSHGTFAGMYTDEGVALQRRFFDYVLKGDDEFVRTQPPVQLHVRTAADTVSERRPETEWPLARTRWTKLYLDVENLALTDTPPAEQAQVTYRGFDKQGVTFLTPPMAEETEICGPQAVKLWASSSTVDADLFLTLRLFDPEGIEVLFHGMADPQMPVSNGWLRASQRKLDEAQSLPFRPYLSHDTVQPLFPDKVYELDVEIWPTNIVVPPGYRLGLMVAGVDFDHGRETVMWGKSGIEMRGSSIWPHVDPLRRPADVYDNEVTLYGGGERTSHLLAAIVPPR
ncbi:CocE/NonD family hydrolase [Pseudonocardia lutea]|uniref:CocE/NonD family hydrolase n=1 Tax=Pseudonocardia lutea TaxID=2172015 RepID=A0ABW1I323_9PSEU